MEINVKLLLEFHKVEIEFKDTKDKHSVEYQIGANKKHCIVTNNHNKYTYFTAKSKMGPRKYLPIICNKGRYYLRFRLSNCENIDISLSKAFYIIQRNQNVDNKHVVVHRNGNNLDFRENNLTLISRRRLLINNLLAIEERKNGNN